MTSFPQNVFNLADDSLQMRFLQQGRQVEAKIAEYFQNSFYRLVGDFIYDEPLYRRYGKARMRQRRTSRFEPERFPAPGIAIQTALAAIFQEQLRELTWRITFHRTLRVPDDGNEYPLPAGLGRFPLRSVQSRLGNALCLPMYSSEAMWMSFSTNFPCAVQIEAGNVNVLTGEPAGGPRRHEVQRKEQNYITWSQPWLDGFCVKPGIVRQFVAKPLGRGQTVGEQLTGQVSNQLTFRLYPMKIDAYFREICLPRLPKRARDLADYLMLNFFERRSAVFYGPSRIDKTDIGLAGGGCIRQQIYQDHYATGTWEETPISFSIQLCHASTWTQLAGEHPPHPPLGVEEYAAADVPWFDYYRDDLPTINPTTKMTSIRSTADFEVENENGEPLKKGLIIQYGNTRRPDAETGIAIPPGSMQ